MGKPENLASMGILVLKWNDIKKRKKQGREIELNTYMKPQRQK
jgi:hypothetical protein